jgi:exopolyphosphatase/guanosine-5'-triphosphate,3'-diphosphate pyrophosphatase
MSFALGTAKAVEQQFYTQVIASAKSLGRKYRFDEEHAVHVAEIALQFFDQFEDELGLDQHARLLLHVAAILHDIGNFVRSSGHHKHSQYLVANSEIFGFSRDDIRIISNVVRYHRQSQPLPAHTAYISLHREQRIVVLKLASILRIAEALDRSHSQRIQSIRLERHDSQLTVHCEHEGDISVERYGMESKASMFEDVFGYEVNVV